MLLAIVNRVRLIKAVFKAAFGLIQGNLFILFLPFLINGIIQLIILTICYWSPRPSLSPLLAPPIRTFWMETYLHYPQNFLLLPKLFQRAHSASTIFIENVFIAVFVGIFYQVFNKERISVLVSIKKAASKYLSIMMAGAFVAVLTYFVVRVLRNMFGDANAVWIIPHIAYILLITFFIYYIPAIIVEGKKAFTSLLRSFSVAKTLLFPSLIFSVILSALYVAVAIVGRKAPVFIRTFPEKTLIVLVLVISLSVITNFISFTLLTTLFMLKRDAEKA